MEDDLQVISTEIVKPSSPTPDHLKWLKLSYLDQLYSNVHIPLVFFYQSSNKSTEEISQKMKQSLSNTLTSFYPLAGRLHAADDNLAVDCNDAGVEFVEARVRARLTDVIQDPDAEDLKKYAPLLMDTPAPDQKPLLRVQITFFGCGGTAIGVNYSHGIADCHSAVTFLNAWAAVCRGEPETPRPVSFDLANYFPAGEAPLIFSDGNSGKCRLKRFVFDREKVGILKKKSVSVQDPTRVEVISAFIWKQIMEAARMRNPKPAKTYAAMHAVNLRGRSSSSSSRSLDDVFGNWFVAASAYADASGFPDEEFEEVVKKLRKSIRKIDEEYITELLNSWNGYRDDISEMVSLCRKGEVERCIFSSWCRFPVYEMDYGFGAPVWYGTTSLPERNSTVFTSNRSGEIEAWVNMEEDELQLLEDKINNISINAD